MPSNELLIDALGVLVAGVFGAVLSVYASAWAVGATRSYYESLVGHETQKVGFEPSDIGDAAQMAIDRFQGVVLLGVVAGFGVARFNTDLALVQTLNLVALLATAYFLYKMDNLRVPRAYVEWISIWARPSDPSRAVRSPVSKLDLWTGVTVALQVAAMVALG